MLKVSHYIVSTFKFDFFTGTNETVFYGQSCLKTLPVFQFKRSIFWPLTSSILRATQLSCKRHLQKRCCSHKVQTGPKTVFKSEDLYCITNKATKIPLTQVPQGLGPLMTNFPERWHGLTKGLLGIPVYLSSCQMHTSVYAFQMAETRENLPTGLQAKLSKHRARQKEKLIRPMVFLLL